MFKNQLQELAQRSCFNLPSYACIREGPDHAPRFKATVTFNGETFESPHFCSTLRQAEHAAAEVALNILSRRGPTQSLAARILDETGVCKNLLQETAQRAGVKLPNYTVVRTGPGHLPVFTCTVEIAGMTFRGESAKTKKQAEKNAATAAWSALKQLGSQGGSSSQASDSKPNEEQEQSIIARALAAAYRDNTSSGALGSTRALQTSHPQAPQRMLGYTTSRIGCVSFLDSPGQAGCSLQTPYFSAPWISVEENGESIQSHRLGPSQHHGGVLIKSGPSYHSVYSDHGQPSPFASVSDAPALPGEAITVGRASAQNFGSVIRSMPVQVRSVPLTSRRGAHEVSPLFEEHQRDDEDWLRGEVTTSDSSCQSSVADRVLPMHSSFNHMLWPHPTQWLSLDAQDDRSSAHARTFRSAASLAPPVRVRPIVAVRSAPPRQPEPDDQNGESKEEAATRQVLSQLRL